MGNQSSNFVTCPNCNIASFDIKRLPIETIVNHINQCYRVKCPYCPVHNIDGFSSGLDLVNHVKYYHNGEYEQHQAMLVCPKCFQSLSNETDLINHHIQYHLQRENDVVCPVCNTAGFKNGISLLKHVELIHSVVLPVMDHDKINIIDEGVAKKLPKVGDRIIAMWGQSRWQYFTATIKRFIKDSLKYEIDWDDGDETGRIVDYFNIAKDRIPDENELGVGSVILFPQGAYKAGKTQVTGGRRWHEGIITHTHTGVDGRKCYNGRHTKTSADGKFTTYRDYDFNFTGLSRHDFRLGPNAFDVIDDAEANEEGEETDIYLSYSLTDSYKAFQNHEFMQSLAPASYVQKYSNICDPADIEDFVRSQGFSVARPNRSQNRDLKQVAGLIKKAKVFIACISDQYVGAESCRMEFQYAKTSLKKPVIPLVVGDGSFNWTTSVVGMLIAGELFIHYSGKGMERAKNAETLSSIKKLLSSESPTKERNTTSEEEHTPPPDVFLSYCWRNSQKAKEANQVKDVNGSMYSDPRLLKDKISDLGYNVWLDIEQLTSANADAGLFGQITQGLKAAKVVVPCISDDYAKSQNCRMEFQFALKSLNKPVVPIIVGKGDEWKQSVVGALIVTHNDEPVSLQGTYSETDFEKKFEEIKISINSQMSRCSPIHTKLFADASRPETKPPQLHSRAPRPGDHVISHHFKWAYYMATVVSFDVKSMTYRIEWDDGDSSGRVQSFNQVAKDIPPEVDDLGVGSIVFFRQGGYGGTEGNNTGGSRYHEGVVTNVKSVQGGTVLVSGRHTKGEEDGKWVTYRAYSYEFHDIQLSEIRLAPTALEAMSI